MALRHALIGAAIALLSSVTAHPPSLPPTPTRTATPNPRAPCPGSVLFDNTDHLRTLVNGYPDFFAKCEREYYYVFTTPCFDCVLSYEDVGLYLRKDEREHVTIETSIGFVDLNPDGTILPILPGTGSSYFDVDLTDTVLPYTLPFRGILYIPPDAPGYLVLTIAFSKDTWWRFPGLIASVPTGNTFNVSVVNFQYARWSDLDVYAANPPIGTDYFPSIFLGGGRQCAPTPSVTASRSPSPSSSRSPSSPLTRQLSEGEQHESNANSVDAAAAGARQMWDSPTPSCSATVTSTSAPCLGRDHVYFFTNIYEQIPILELLDEIRLKAHQPFAITFSPPCRGCTVELEGIHMILKATDSVWNASLAIQVCQYDEFYASIVNCASAPSVIVQLKDLPTLVNVPINLNYTIPHHLSNDLKFIITPSENIQWLMSGPAPNKPARGVSHPSRVQIQPFCEECVLAAHNGGSEGCPDYVPNWADLGVFPSMNLYGYVPCFVRPPVCALYDELAGPTDNALLSNQCIDDCKTLIVDTIKNSSLANTASMHVEKYKNYYVWFENPCYGQEYCEIKDLKITLPLQALKEHKIRAYIGVVGGGDEICNIYDDQVMNGIFVGNDHYFRLGPNDQTQMETFEINYCFSSTWEDRILGVYFSFSDELLWHYGLPLVSFSLNDFPLMTIDNWCGCYHGFVLPGVRIAAKLDNTTCVSEESVFWNSSTSTADTLIETCPPPVYYPTPIRPPIDCFGTGQITVADNTLRARFLFESGTILEPLERYAIEFGLPCTRCVVHLTHLTLPLSAISAGVITFDINVVILTETTPGHFVYIPAINAEWTDISTSVPVFLTYETGFYTIPLPDSFTLAALPDPRLRYVMRFTVSNYVMVHDGLVPPQFPITHDNTTDPYARLLVETYPGEFLRSPEVPGFWIRSWADPFAECIPSIPSPSSTPPPSGGGVTSPTASPFPIVSPYSPRPLPTGIIAFISFEIIIWIPSFSPLDIFGDASFLFVFRLVIALFFGVPMGDVSIGDCYHMPSHTLWFAQPPFGTARRLEAVEMRNLQDATGMSTRVNIVSGRNGEADRTDELLRKLFDDSDGLVTNLAADSNAQARGLTADNLEVDTSRLSYVGGSQPSGVTGGSSSSGGSDLSGGAIAGIVVGCLVAAALVALGVVGYQKWSNGESNTTVAPQQAAAAGNANQTNTAAPRGDASRPPAAPGNAAPGNQTQQTNERASV